CPRARHHPNQMRIQLPREPLSPARRQALQQFRNSDAYLALLDIAESRAESLKQEAAKALVDARTEGLNIEDAEDQLKQARKLEDFISLLGTLSAEEIGWWRIKP